MAKKKIKTDAPTETPSAPIHLAEDKAQHQNGAKTLVLEAAVLTVDPEVTEDLVVQKPARTAKRKAAKSRSTEPIAEQTAPVIEKTAEEKEQVEEPAVTVDPAAESLVRAIQEETELPEIEPVAEETASSAKKNSKEKASGKGVKMKRLTLDIPKPLHKAIKAQAVEEGISIVDMLRTLLEQHYGK